MNDKLGKKAAGSGLTLALAVKNDELTFKEVVEHCKKYQYCVAGESSCGLSQMCNDFRPNQINIEEIKRIIRGPGGK